MIVSSYRRCDMKLFASIDLNHVSPEKAEELLKMFQCCGARNKDKK